ncbi:MAG: K(+)/H(+) antiporter [Thelocarpon superellum]|nr:MAG: K(+)/H(+) antiporter [Thelocarpon superellum]
MASSTASAAATSTKVPAQGGILEGANPSVFDPKNPIIVFIIQAGIIIVFCRLLHFPLSRIRQPRVIAEVIGGILLGPSVMGRIPGFTNAIFPPVSLPPLTMAANLGLILFLFLVGLEVDLRIFKLNWRVALSVSAAGMALPFGLGCAIAWGLYNQFRDEPGTVHISFGVYMLFIGVAMAITAFPVLCRILTELKLLHTEVGVIVLSAGVGNDVTGWILLALCVALVNAGTGLTALWVLLTCVAYVLFLVYVVRPAFIWLLRRTGSLHNGPTQSIVALTVLMALSSAFFTGIIGVHPIFGGFLIGVICPHDGGFAIKLTEKIEDLVSVLLLPLYFALSGLSTNIGLLNNGITWAYVIGVISVAFVGKVIGGTLAARSCKLVWRESLTIGVLMSCKGLVELIVLNIGLQAKILSTRTFTIFVVMALITTFATTPLTTALYPPWYQKKLAAWKRGEIEWDGTKRSPTDDASDKDPIATEKLRHTQVRKLLVQLRLDSLPSLFTFIALLGGTERRPTVEKVHRLKQDGATNAGADGYGGEAAGGAGKAPLQVHGLRLLELTERTSSVMKGSEAEDFAHRDPIVNAFYTFGALNNVAVSGGLAVVPEDAYADTLTTKAADLSSDLVIIPWSETGSITEEGHSLLQEGNENRFTSDPHNHFIHESLAHATSDTAIFVNRGFGGTRKHEPPPLSRVVTGLSMRSNRDVATAPVTDRSHHIFFPFFGGPDDHSALRFVLQLAQNANVTATIIRVVVPQASGSGSGSDPDIGGAAESASVAHHFRLPLRKGATEVSPTQSADSTDKHDGAFFTALKDSLPRALERRVLFDTVTSTQPLKDTVARAKAEVGLSPNNAGDLVVVGRGRTSRRDVRSELMAMLTPLGYPTADGAGTRDALGDVAEAMLVAGLKASVLALQAATPKTLG